MGLFGFTAKLLLATALGIGPAALAACPSQPDQPTLKQRLLDGTAGIKVQLGVATRKLSAEAYAIFDRVHADSSYVLAPAEEALIKAEGAETLLTQYREASNSVKKLNRALAILYRSKNKGPGRVGWRRVFNVPGYLFPSIVDIKGTRANLLFDKLLENPLYQPTEGERAFLKKWNLTADFERYRKDIDIHPTEFVTLTHIRTAGTVAKWGVAATAAGIGVFGQDYISNQESFDDKSQNGMSRYDDKVELIFLSPLPHASIRIGGVVYNYGPMTMDRYTLAQFRKSAGFGSSVSGSHTRIELKLTPAEKKKLRDYLEGDVGKMYPLVFPYNDCVSQTNKALLNATGIDVPTVADRSQAGTIAYFKMLKWAGSDRIGPIRFASRDGNAIEAKSKDAAMNVLDSAYFIKNALGLYVATPILDRSRLTFTPPADQE